MSVPENQRQYAPSTARNRDVICETFLEHMPRSGAILEIAAGTGEHGVHIIEAAPELDWVFTDYDADCRKSQAAWITHTGRSNLKGPYALDASASDWGEKIEALTPAGIFCANMIHITPFEVCEGLFAGAGRLLSTGGRMFLYGPYRRQGKQTAPSNEAFEDWLKSKDARYGVRDLDSEVLPLADANALQLVKVINMPANNFSLIFEKL